MNRPQTSTPSRTLSLLVLALLAVGLVEAVGVGWLVARDGVGAASAVVASAQLLWPLWLGVILTVVSGAIHQSVRYAVALVALLMGSFRAGVHVLVLAETVLPTDPVVAVLQAVPALVGPLILALWAVVDALRRRPSVPPEPQVSPIADVMSLRVPPPGSPPPTSPATPISQPIRPARVTPGTGAMWNQVASPWPRAVEDDPDGTLVRPPRRRSAL